MATPRYSYQAINQLALGDTGHFVFLDAWTCSLLDSMLSQNRALWFWANDQNPLDQAEIDDLDNKLSTAQGQLMQSLVGLIMPVCTADLPEGTLLCDGSTYARADYPNLYDALDPAYQIDADNFTVPDMTDRFVVGPGTHATNATGGSFSHVQSVGEMAAHSHSSAPHTHTEITATPTAVTIGLEVPVPAALPGVGITGAATVSISTEGNSDPMDITPPFIALRFVVVAL